LQSYSIYENGAIFMPHNVFYQHVLIARQSFISTP